MAKVHSELKDLSVLGRHNAEIYIKHLNSIIFLKKKLVQNVLSVILPVS